MHFFFNIMEHQWSIKKLCFEFDTEPYYQGLDDKVKVSIEGAVMCNALICFYVTIGERLMLALTEICLCCWH